MSESTQAIEKIWRRVYTNQKHYANAAGVANSRLNKWFNGRGRLFYWELYKVARALKLTMDFVCDDEQVDPEAQAPIKAPPVPAPEQRGGQTIKGKPIRSRKRKSSGSGKSVDVKPGR